MYNRYIPQSDGSYSRRRVPEHNQQEPKLPPGCPVSPPPPSCAPSPQPPPPPRKRPARPPQPEQSTESIPGFFKNLLPRNIDTADLLIIVLLLLMAGDNEESKNNALLTLALYFFM
jgi:hypothetical protein